MTDTTDIAALREQAETAKVCGGMFAISGEQALVLLDQLEAERQRANESGERFYKAVQYGAKLEAEIEALKGDQVPLCYGWFHKDTGEFAMHVSRTNAHNEYPFVASLAAEGYRPSPVYDRPQKPVVLPQPFTLRAGHPFHEGERTAMIPDDKGNWLSKFDVEHAIKMAGGIVKDGE